MRDTTALSTPYVIGSLHTTRPPMSEARRQQIHGKLLPMDRPLKDEGTGYDHLPIWDEQPRFLTGVAWIVGMALIGAGLWAMLP